MNKVNLIGRLTNDPKINNTQNNFKIASYTLAVNRRFKKDGEQTADFINCKLFGKQAEFAEKYLKKGIKIAVSGHIQTGVWEKSDGTKVYTTDIVIEEQEFCESKTANEKQVQQDAPATTNSAPTTQADATGFLNYPDDGIAELPFA